MLFQISKRMQKYGRWSRKPILIGLVSIFFVSFAGFAQENTYTPIQNIGQACFDSFASKQAYPRSLVQQTFALYPKEQPWTDQSKKVPWTEGFTSQEKQNLWNDSTQIYLNQLFYQWITFEDTFGRGARFEEKLTEKLPYGMTKLPNVSKAIQTAKTVFGSQASNLRSVADPADLQDEINFVNTMIGEVNQVCKTRSATFVDLKKLYADHNAFQTSVAETGLDAKTQNLLYPQGQPTNMVTPGGIAGLIRTRMQEERELGSIEASLYRTLISRSKLGYLIDTKTDLQDRVGIFSPLGCVESGDQLRKINSTDLILPSVKQIEKRYRDTVVRLTNFTDTAQGYVKDFIRENPASVLEALVVNPNQRHAQLVCSYIHEINNTQQIKEGFAPVVIMAGVILTATAGPEMSPIVAFGFNAFIAGVVFTDLVHSYAMQKHIEEAIIANQIPSLQGQEIIRSLKNERPLSYLNLALAGLGGIGSLAKINQMMKMDAEIQALNKKLSAQGGSTLEKFKQSAKSGEKTKVAAKTTFIENPNATKTLSAGEVNAIKKWFSEGKVEGETFVGKQTTTTHAKTTQATKQKPVSDDPLDLFSNDPSDGSVLAPVKPDLGPASTTTINTTQGKIFTTEVFPSIKGVPSGSVVNQVEFSPLLSTKQNLTSTSTANLVVPNMLVQIPPKANYGLEKWEEEYLRQFDPLLKSDSELVSDLISILEKGFITSEEEKLICWLLKNTEKHSVNVLKVLSPVYEKYKNILTCGPSTFTSMDGSASTEASSFTHEFAKLYQITNLSSDVKISASNTQDGGLIFQIARSQNYLSSQSGQLYSKSDLINSEFPRIIRNSLSGSSGQKIPPVPYAANFSLPGDLIQKQADQAQLETMKKLIGGNKQNAELYQYEICDMVLRGNGEAYRIASQYGLDCSKPSPFRIYTSTLLDPNKVLNSNDPPSNPPNVSNDSSSQEEDPWIKVKVGDKIKKVRLSTLLIEITSIKALPSRTKSQLLGKDDRPIRFLGELIQINPSLDIRNFSDRSVDITNDVLRSLYDLEMGSVILREDVNKKLLDDKTRLNRILQSPHSAEYNDILYFRNQIYNLANNGSRHSMRSALTIVDRYPSLFNQMLSQNNNPSEDLANKIAVQKQKDTLLLMKNNAIYNPTYKSEICKMALYDKGVNGDLARNYVKGHGINCYHHDIQYNVNSPVNVKIGTNTDYESSKLMISIFDSTLLRALDVVYEKSPYLYSRDYADICKLYEMKNNNTVLDVKIFRFMFENKIYCFPDTISFFGAQVKMNPTLTTNFEIELRESPRSNLLLKSKADELKNNTTDYKQFINNLLYAAYHLSEIYDNNRDTDNKYARIMAQQYLINVANSGAENLYSGNDTKIYQYFKRIYDSLSTMSSNEVADLHNLIQDIGKSIDIFYPQNDNLEKFIVLDGVDESLIITIPMIQFEGEGLRIDYLLNIDWTDARQDISGQIYLPAQDLLHNKYILVFEHPKYARANAKSVLQKKFPNSFDDLETSVLYAVVDTKNLGKYKSPEMLQREIWKDIYIAYVLKDNASRAYDHEKNIFVSVTNMNGLNDNLESLRIPQENIDEIKKKLIEMGFSESYDNINEKIENFINGILDSGQAEYKEFQTDFAYMTLMLLFSGEHNPNQDLQMKIDLYSIMQKQKAKNPEKLRYLIQKMALEGLSNNVFGLLTNYIKSNGEKIQTGTEIKDIGNIYRGFYAKLTFLTSEEIANLEKILNGTDLTFDFEGVTYPIDDPQFDQEMVLLEPYREEYKFKYSDARKYQDKIWIPVSNQNNQIEFFIKIDPKEAKVKIFTHPTLDMVHINSGHLTSLFHGDLDAYKDYTYLNEFKNDRTLVLPLKSYFFDQALLDTQLSSNIVYETIKDVVGYENLGHEIFDDFMWDDKYPNKAFCIFVMTQAIPSDDQQWSIPKSSKFRLTQVIKTDPNDVNAVKYYIFSPNP